MALLLSGALLVCGYFFPPAAAALSDEKNRWMVGVAEFSGDGLSRENGYLLSSVPMQLLDALAGIRTHTLDPTEIEARRKRVLDRAIAGIRKDLAIAYVNYDRLFLTEGPGGAQRNRLADRIATDRERLSLLESMDAGEVSVPDRKPVQLVEGETGRLLAPVLTGPEAATDAYGLDMLVYGRVEQVSEYLFVDVVVHYTDDGRERTFSTGGSLEGMRERIEELRGEMVSLLYGAPSGSLRIVAEHPESRITLDHRYLGSGSRTIRPIAAGEHRIVVETPGYRSATHEFDIEIGDEALVTATPGTKIDGSVSVKTTPAGASVYVGSRLAGRSPVEIVPPLETTQLYLELEGYGSHQTTLTAQESGGSSSDGGRDETIIELLPVSLSERELVRSRRWVFYRSLGMFAISVPVPLFLLDITNQLTSVVNSEFPGTAEFDRLFERRQMAYSGYVAGLFISGSLLINFITDLMDYVDLVGLRTG